MTTVDEALAVFREISRLTDAGFSLIPLGGGSDGKSPLVKFSGKQISQAQTLGIMRKRGSSLYGVRTDRLAVCDVDQRSEELFSMVTERCGDTPVQVDTPRGRHFYFANPEGVRHSFAGEPIDFKTGLNSYVAGPCSIRSDGRCYEPFLGSLGVSVLPAIKPPPQGAFTASGRVSEGSRNTHLTKAAVRMVSCVDTVEELTANLIWERDTICEAGAHPVTDPEVEKIGRWAWGKRQTGDIWGGERMLGFRHATAQALITDPNGGGRGFRALCDSERRSPIS